MLQLHHRETKIAVENVPHYGAAEDASARHFDREISLDDTSGYHTTSKHAITIRHHSELIASVIVLAGGGASGVHKNSAIILGDTLLLAIGLHIACLTLPTLKLNWATQTDDATCFGVHYSRSHHFILSHGELQISALTPDGTIIWSAAGADIFTNGFTFDDNRIIARDFNDRDYVIDIASGTPRGG